MVLETEGNKSFLFPESFTIIFVVWPCSPQINIQDLVWLFEAKNIKFLTVSKTTLEEHVVRVA